MGACAVREIGVLRVTSHTVSRSLVMVYADTEAVPELVDHMSSSFVAAAFALRRSAADEDL